MSGSLVLVLALITWQVVNIVDGSEYRLFRVVVALLGTVVLLASLALKRFNWKLTQDR